MLSYIGIFPPTPHPQNGQGNSGDGESRFEHEEQSICETYKYIGARLEHLSKEESWIRYGGPRSEVPKKFLDQFLKCDDQWPTKKLFATAKSKHTFKALTWF